MIKLIERFFNLRKKKFVQDTAILQIASFFSTGLSIIGSIIYARVLGVEGYASYALIFVFAGLLELFADFGTQQGTLTLLAEAYATQNKQKIIDVLTYYVKVTVLVSVLVGLVLIAISPFLTARLYNSAEIGKLVRVIILTDIIKVFFWMYIIVLQVVRRIKRLAIIENINKITYVVIPVSAVLFGLGLWGLVFSHLLTAGCFLIYSFVAYNILRSKEPLLPAWKEIFANWNKVQIGYYFKFGFLIAIDKNLSSLYGILPIFLLGIFSLKDVAFLKIASSYAGLPSIFLAGPVSRLLSVQLPKSKSYSLRILKRDYIRSALGSLLITAVISIVFIVLSPILVPLIYGKEYLPVVFLTYPLLIGTVFINLGVGSGPLFRTLNLMKKVIVIDLIFITLGGGIIYYFVKNYPIDIAIYSIALWLPIEALVTFFYLIRQLNKKIKASREELKDEK